MVSNLLSFKALIFYAYKQNIEIGVKPTYMFTNYGRMSMTFLQDIPNKTNLTKHQLSMILEVMEVNGAVWETFTKGIHVAAGFVLQLGKFHFTNGQIRHLSVL